MASAIFVVITKANSKPRKIDRITLRRKEGDSKLPTLEMLTLNSDGLATYDGIGRATRVGKFQGTFSTNEFSRLCQHLERNGFWSLQSRYQTTPFWSDQRTVSITVVADNEIKTVFNYEDAGPKELEELEGLIHSLGNEITNWKKVDSK